MALKFILGPSGEERSEIIYRHAVEVSMDTKKKIYLIVPEQYTLSSQKGLVNAHPRHALLNIDVVSFNRLAYKLLSKTGGFSTPIIRDSGKNMIIRSILKKNEKSFRYFSPRLKKRGLISELKSLISEFDQYGVSSQDLCELKEHFAADRSGRLKDKIEDIEYIFTRFHEEIRSRYVTQEELLDVLKRKLDETDALKGSAVFFDGFTGFTTTQYKLLETIIRQADDVEISVTYDVNDHPSGVREYEVFPRESGKDFATSGNLFFMSDDFINKSIDAASNAGKKCSGYIYVCDDKKSIPGELLHLRRNLFRFTDMDKPFGGDCSAVSLTKAKDTDSELFMVMNRIYDLTRNKGYRYRDIAIVTEDIGLYGEQAKRLAQKNGFPAFVDSRKGVAHNPYIENIRAILQVFIKGWSYENVFRLLKTGFFGVSEDDTDILDSYCLAAGIDRKQKWNKSWEYKAKKIKKNETDEIVPYYDLEDLNKKRKDIYEILDSTEKSLKKCKDVSSMLSALRGYLERDTIRTRIEELTEDAEYGEEFRQIKEKCDDIFSEMDGLFGKEKADIEEFAEVLDSAFEELSLGFIPPTVDCITIGDIERTRLTNIKALFVVGVNDGLIPSKNTETGILSQAERLKLSEKNINLAPAVSEKAFIQKFYLYLLLTKPFEKLFISYAGKSSDGTDMLPSYLIKNIKEILPSLKEEGKDEETHKNMSLWLPEAKKIWLPGDLQQEISQETAFDLYGNVLKGSISSLEKYAGCPFSFYANAGLRLEPREIYEFNPADFGTVIHEILKDILRDCEKRGIALASLSDEEISALVDVYTQKNSQDFYILNEGARQEFVRRRINELSVRSVKTIGSQLAAGEYKTDLTEHRFSISHDLDDNKTFVFNGMIDRVDVARGINDDGFFVRVVDYKTGTYDFDLLAAYLGRRIQLISYLGAAVEEEKRLRKKKEIYPAGMLYYNISNPIVKEDDSGDQEKIEQKIRKELAMKGVVSQGSILLSDRDRTGEVVDSIKFGKDGVKNNNNIFSQEQLEKLAEFETEKMKNMAGEILNGNISTTPLRHKEPAIDACAYCNYKDVCNFTPGVHGGKERHVPSVTKDEIWEMIGVKKDE